LGFPQPREWLRRRSHDDAPSRGLGVYFVHKAEPVITVTRLQFAALLVFGMSHFI